MLGVSMCGRDSPFADRPAEHQVFHDPTGQRERLVRHAALAAALLSALWLTALIAGGAGLARLPLGPPRFGSHGAQQQHLAPDILRSARGPYRFVRTASGESMLVRAGPPNAVAIREAERTDLDKRES